MTRFGRSTAAQVVGVFVFSAVVCLVAAGAYYHEGDARDAISVCTSSSPNQDPDLTCGTFFPPKQSAVVTLVTENDGDVPSEKTYVDTNTFTYDRYRPSPDGTRARVATCPIGVGHDVQDEKYRAERMEEARVCVEQAAKENVDALLLPEEFAGTLAEPVEGGYLSSNLGVLAHLHKMYIVFGMREIEPSTNKLFNTAVILSRSGEVVGSYRKMFPCCPPPARIQPPTNEGVVPGDGGVPVFDLDFGRVALLTCYDANFMEGWQQAYALGADLVFWPSAYGGGMPLRGYAMLYKYYIVPNGWGDIIDIDGQVVSDLQKKGKITFSDIDLDKTFIHTDFNGELADQLLEKYKGLIEMVHDPIYVESNNILLRRTDKGFEEGIKVKDVLREFDIEPLRTYQQRARQTINIYRQDGKLLRQSKDDDANL